MKVVTIVGPRANILKAIPVSRVLCEAGHDEFLVNTGYRDSMAERLFWEANAPEPKANLGVESGLKTHRIWQILTFVEEILQSQHPDWVVVYGDDDCAIAGTLAAAQLNIPVAHLEAGERLYRRKNAPGELNRVLADHGSWLCFTSTERGRNHLLREGMSPERVRFVGDSDWDLFNWIALNQLHSRFSQIGCQSFGLEEGDFHLAVIRRIGNNGYADRLAAILNAADTATKPVLLLLSPQLEGFLKVLQFKPKGSLHLIKTASQFDYLNLLLQCEKCITDSNDVVKHAFFARKACIISMNNTYWNDITEAGWAIETGTDLGAFLKALEEFTAPEQTPEQLFGDGDSARRVVWELSREYNKNEEGFWHQHGNVSCFPIFKPRAGQFTYREYASLVQDLKDSGYRFARFAEAADLLAARQSFVLMRHDVDMCLESALRLAEIESGLGITSTYFFILRTDHYNIFSKRGTEYVSQILALGHQLGLHFDPCAYDHRGPDTYFLREVCSTECRLLENWFEHPISIVSYHRPSPFLLQGDPAITAPRHHTYMSLYTKDIKYFSDSGGEWRFGKPIESDAFRQGLPMQILIHPIWWTNNPLSAYDRLLSFVQKTKEALELSIAQNCRTYRIGHLSRCYENEAPQ